MSYDWVSFTTDYGLGDGFVAACEGVIARIAPDVRVLHVSHAVAPHDVRGGGAVLAHTVPFLPAAVHVAVVDPGVGTDRLGMVVVAGESLLVGPDNGLLIPAADALGGAHAAYQLAEPTYQLSRVSATFHGRDVFAPAAAHLAAGVAPERFGPALDVASLVRLAQPHTEAVPGRLTTEVLSVDRFGNIQLAATRADLDAVGARPNGSAHVNLGGRSVAGRVGRTFADAGPEDTLVYVDSADRVAIAVYGASAADELGATPGERVLVLFAR